MIVDYQDYKIHCAEDRFIKEVLIGREYEFALKNNVIIDIGANIGTYSIYAYDMASIIYAIEPAKNEFEYLVKNVEENNLSKIKTFNFALGRENGRGVLSVEQGTGSGTLHGDPEKTDYKFRDEVEIKTLGTFIKENNIKYVDMLKIDAEKAEIDIFSAEDFKEVSEIIPLIFGEKHGNDNEVKELLEKNHYQVEFYGSHFRAKRR